MYLEKKNMDAIYLFNIFILTCLFLITGIWCYIICIWLKSIENSPKLIEERNKNLYSASKSKHHFTC